MDSLEFFYELVLPGGVIAFDEYKNPKDIEKWPGASVAIDEFIGKQARRIQRDAVSRKYYFVKNDA